MLRSLTIVAGLPGSGKTTWCRAQQARLPFLAVVDDPSVDISQWENIDTNTEHALVSDPRFCAMGLDKVRNIVRSFCPHLGNDTQVKWVSFPNNLEASHARCVHKAAGLSQRLHKNFVVPEGGHCMEWNATTLWEDIPFLRGEKHALQRPSF